MAAVRRSGRWLAWLVLVLVMAWWLSPVETQSPATIQVVTPSGTTLARLGTVVAGQSALVVVIANTSLATTTTVDSVTVVNTVSMTQVNPFSVIFSGTQNVLAYPTGVTSTTSTGPLLVYVYDGTSRMTSFNPCERIRPQSTTININGANNTRIVTGASASYTFLCGLLMFSAGTVNVGIVEGTGSQCASNIGGLIGGTTAATGPNLTAQTGFSAWPGHNFVAVTSRTNMDFCLITSATVQLSGVVTWVLAP